MYYLQISHEIIFYRMGNILFFPKHFKYNSKNFSELQHNFHNYNILRIDCYLHLRIPHGLYVRIPDDGSKQQKARCFYGFMF